MAHGDDPEDESTAEISDEHTEEGDVHAGPSNTSYVSGGIAGAALLVAGAAFLFSSQLSIMTLVGLALIGATGVIHIMVGSIWGDTLLLLNGIGFFGLGILWVLPNQFIPNQKRILGIVLALYTLVTILGYFFTHDHYDFVAILTKAIEAPLLIILVISALQSPAEA